MFTAEQKKMFKGMGVLVLTPFHEDFSLDICGLKSNMEYQKRQGLTKDNGFFVTDGSMGECCSMTLEERKEVIRATVEAAGEIAVIAGVNDSSHVNVIELINYSENVGAKAVLLAPPFYQTYSAEQIYYFYKFVHDRTSLPIMLYNNPMIAGIDLSISMIKKLAELERVFAIKQATLQTTNFVQSEGFTDKLLFFAASSSQQPLGSFNGASGFISFISSVNLPLQLRLWNAIEKGDWETAKECHREEMLLYGWWWNGGAEQPCGPIVHMKKAMDLIGLHGGPVRPPLMPQMSKNEVEGLKKILHAWGIL